MSLRIEQDQRYHSFADERSWVGIDNAVNTSSTLPLLAIGILGLVLLWRNSAATPTLRFEVPAERYAYWALFGAVALTSIGSMYYHLAPDDARLVWDRLPLSLAFTALVSAMISDRIGVKDAASTFLRPDPLAPWHGMSAAGIS